MQMNRFTKKIIKRRIDKKNIQLIKESGYFDEKYYLRNNHDVKEAGVNPIVHYYHNGWKEGRNPSQKFDTNKYLQYFGNVKENPILHYLKYKNQYPDFAVPYAETVTVSNILKAYYYESESLKTKVVVKRKKHRINIIFKEFNRDIFFGGKSVPLLLAIILCNQYDYDLRIISSEVEANIFYKILELHNLNFKQNVEFFSTSFNMYLDVCQNDDFICTSWDNVEKVLNTSTINGKIFYLIQDAELNYYGTGDEYLRVLDTIINERIIPIVDSKILYDYLIKREFNNIKKNGIYFEPAFSKEMLKPKDSTFKKKDKYKLLYYATPSPKENLFYFSLEVLNKALERGVLNPLEWEIYVLGNEFVPTIEFDSNIKVEMLEDISWTDYCNLLSDIDLCFCTTFALRPDYEVLNAISSGAVCLTNNNDNKKDLSFYSKNIVMSDLELSDMLKNMEEAIKLSLNFSKRKENYENSNTYNSWNNAFKEVLEFMNKHIGE